ncbi:MAG TPA: hypothetical protein VJ953_21080 [Saprospiraceae bacterium]|nr:hypothetical protein [Saprospiraceae bacterium]
MATKKAKKPEAQLKNNLEKVKDSAVKTGKKYKETATDYVKDLYEDSEKWFEKTTEDVKQTVSKINFEDGYNTVKDFSSKANKYATDTAEDVVDGAISSGEKWQAIASKAIKGGLDLAAKQQEIFFDTLESVKGQVKDGTKRTKKLFK